MKESMETKQQDGAYASPWSTGHKIKALIWHVVWSLLYRPTPKPLYRWRVWLLKIFGADITGHCYVAASSKVKFPWLLAMRDRAALGDHVEVYNLGPCSIGARSTIAQHAYLCGGTHDLTTRDLPLVVAPVTIGEDVFVGAKALLLPGVVVNDRAVVGAGAVVTKSVDPDVIVGGNPAKVIGRRTLR